ncbi:hypothetical protein C8R43DRAFT_1101394 [Mycena crocata]|nr:hypothetical protein C8R43DRAFT_1101394 [Mycena crocata]
MSVTFSLFTKWPWGNVNVKRFSRTRAGIAELKTTGVGGPARPIRSIRPQADGSPRPPLPLHVIFRVGLPPRWVAVNSEKGYAAQGFDGRIRVHGAVPCQTESIGQREISTSVRGEISTSARSEISTSVPRSFLPSLRASSLQQATNDLQQATNKSRAQSSTYVQFVHEEGSCVPTRGLFEGSDDFGVLVRAVDVVAVPAEVEDRRIGGGCIDDRRAPGRECGRRAGRRSMALLRAAAATRGVRVVREEDVVDIDVRGGPEVRLGGGGVGVNDKVHALMRGWELQDKIGGAFLFIDSEPI